MRTPEVFLLLGVSALLMSASSISAVSLSVQPNRQQFFSGQSASLRCVAGGRRADGWTVRRIRGGQTEECGVAADFGVSKESTCVLDLLSSYSGLYWCETSSGGRSDYINITVSTKEGGTIILDIPALPVMTGSDVTLHCVDKGGVARTAYFYKNGHLVGSEQKVLKLIIHEVQQTDEGPYWCASDKFGSSPHGFLRVEGSPVPHNNTASSPPPGFSSPPPGFSSPPPESSSPPPSVSMLHVLRHLVVICPYCICSVLLVSICCRRNSGHRHGVSMATSQPVAEFEDAAADVTTEHEF